MTISRSRWLLCIPPVAMALLDGGLTVSLQPASYWLRPETVNEGSPLWYQFLSRGPWAYAAAATVYLAAVCACIHILPKRAALTASLTVTLWHVVGASSWVLDTWGNTGYWTGVVGLAAVSMGLVRLWEAAGFGPR